MIYLRFLKICVHQCWLWYALTVWDATAFACCCRARLHPWCKATVIIKASLHCRLGNSLDTLSIGSDKDDSSSEDPTLRTCFTNTVQTTNAISQVAWLGFEHMTWCDTCKFIKDSFVLDLLLHTETVCTVLHWPTHESMVGVKGKYHQLPDEFISPLLNDSVLSCLWWFSPVDPQLRNRWSVWTHKNVMNCMGESEIQNPSHTWTVCISAFMFAVNKLID